MIENHHFLRLLVALAEAVSHLNDIHKNLHQCSAISMTALNRTLGLAKKFGLIMDVISFDDCNGCSSEDRCGSGGGLSSWSDMADGCISGNFDTEWHW